MLKCSCPRAAVVVAVAGIVCAGTTAIAQMNNEAKKDAKFVPQAIPVPSLERALYGPEEIERLLTKMKGPHAIAEINDTCDSAILLDIGEPAMGSTANAEPDPGAGASCGTSITAPGVWYAVEGTGNGLTASLCGSFYDTKVSVFCGDCNSLNCVGGNDDFCSTQSQFSWCSEAGTTYYVLVHGFSSATGDFTIVVTDDGLPCANPPDCDSGGGGGGNDLCDDAIDLGMLPASVDGSTEGATTDTGVAVDCGAASVTSPGVWYSFVGNGNNVVASLCGGASFDTKISAFSGTCDALTCVAGNDDACGLQSEIEFCANTGVTYFILVHGYGGATGPFTLNVSELGPCECFDICEAGDLPEGEPVCYDEYDDMFNGGCNSLVPVFSDIACGDSVCGTSGTFLFTDPVFGLSEYRDTDWFRFSLTEATEVTFSATTGFPGLIGIVDTGGIDDCSLVSAFLTSTFTDACVETSVTAIVPAGTWYAFVSTADFTGVACGSEYRCSLDCTALPTGACCIAGMCVDDLAEVDCDAANGLYQGDGTACDDVTCPVPPANDDCADAIGPLGVPSTTPGTTVLANIDLCDPPNSEFCYDCGAAIISSPGVWYTVIGTGNTMTASLCNGVAAYDSKLSVFCGTCDDPVCIDGNDDSCGLQSEVSWCSQLGAEYLVLVHGFGGQTGDFELELYDDGTPCGGATQCLPEGACCLADESCVISTEIGCQAMGGEYVGDDTQCAGSGYFLANCDSDFEDISGTGTEVFLGDEIHANDIPLGFTFEFYGLSWTDISISDNGFLSFEFLSGNTYVNQDIPDTDTPNNVIAPYWDDLDTSVGSVHYQTLGTAPNRRFIAQWTDVPQFFDIDSNTFQAVLYEGSNAIEFRYGVVSGPSFSGDVTIGIENPSGTEAVAANADLVGQGDCLRFEDVTRPDPCNEPPVCGDGSIITIWPPNHEAYAIDMTTDAGITDPDGDDLMITITSITQDEDINGLGDGNTTCDAGWTGTDAFVRRERSGTGDGRVYHINYTVDDGRGGTCSGTLIVEVPHNQNSSAVDSGQDYDSTPCFGRTDVNADGVTDIVDMEIVIENYGQVGPDLYLNWPDGDVNGDARTDVLDMHLVMITMNAQGDSPADPEPEETDVLISPNQQLGRETNNATMISR